MKKNLLYSTTTLLILIILLGSCYINYRVFDSMNNQSYLLYEFNSYSFNLPIEEVSKFNDELPNVTVTTLPLKMMKARYYMNKDTLIQDALHLFYESKKANPFLKIADFELAKYHYKISNVDSAEFYSKQAFEALPKNYLYSRQYFQILANQKKDKELDLAFNKIKGNYIIDQWRDYFFNKIKINETPIEQLQEILNEAKIKISNKDQFSTIETILDVGYENLDDLGKIIIEAEAFYKQDKFTKAANLYESAARMNDTEYTHYENAALSFYRGDNFEQAEKLFRYVLSSFEVKNGKSEFYLGLLLYEKKELENACNFWNIAINKNYPTALKVKQTFCK